MGRWQRWLEGRYDKAQEGGVSGRDSRSPGGAWRWNSGPALVAEKRPGGACRRSRPLQVWLHRFGGPVRHPLLDLGGVARRVSGVPARRPRRGVWQIRVHLRGRVAQGPPGRHELQGRPGPAGRAQLRTVPYGNGPGLGTGRAAGRAGNAGQPVRSSEVPGLPVLGRQRPPV